MRSATPTWWLVAGLSVSAGAAAQPRSGDPESRGAEAVVTAPSGQPQRIRESSRSVSSAGAVEARRALAHDLGERLEEVPGVFVQRTTSASAAPVLRGLGGQRTLLLFDGIRLNDSLTRVGSNALLNLVDPAVVQRVEVLRGPASVLYGSDALGGVVAVVPFDAWPRDDRAARSHAAGSLRAAGAERSLRSTVLAESESGAFGLLASGALGTAGLTSMAGGRLLPYSGYDDRAASVRGTWRPSRNHRVGLAVHTGVLADVARPDLSTADDLRSFRLQRRDLAYAWWQGSVGGHRVSARGGWTRREEVRDRVRPTRLDVEVDEVHTLHFSGQLDLRRGATTVSVGIDASRDHVASRTETSRESLATSTGRGRYVDGSRYLTSGLFALWQRRVAAHGRWRFELGGRVSLVSPQAPSDGALPPFDETLVAPVASAGVRFVARDGVAVLANLLGGFRAPNLDDWQAQGSGARSFDVPNPSLGPERSWTAELGLRVDLENFALSAFAYGSLLVGLIARVPAEFEGRTEIDGRRVYTRSNASEAWLAGAEVDLAWRARAGLRVAIGASGTWAEATLPSVDGTTIREPLAKVPPPFGRASLGWRWARAWADLVFTGALAQTRLAGSDRDDPRLCPRGPDDCTEVPSYGVFAVRAGLEAREGVTLGVAVENVIDRAYTPYSAGQPGAGRNVLASLRLSTR